MSIFRDGLYIRLINEFEIANGSSEYYLLGAALIIFAVVASYLLGSLSSAIIVSKTLYKEDIRKYGSVPHAGFGMGIERMVRWICGLQHVRETIPFARMMDKIHP